MLRHVEFAWAEHAARIAGAGVDGPPLRLGNTALTTVDQAAPWRVLRLGCAAHLDDASADDPRGGSGL